LRCDSSIVLMIMSFLSRSGAKVGAVAGAERVRTNRQGV
jgi:hypothetical protein